MLTTKGYRVLHYEIPASSLTSMILRGPLRQLSRLCTASRSVNLKYLNINNFYDYRFVDISYYCGGITCIYKIQSYWLTYTWKEWCGDVDAVDGAVRANAAVLVRTCSGARIPSYRRTVPL